MDGRKEGRKEVRKELYEGRKAHMKQGRMDGMKK